MFGNQQDTCLLLNSFLSAMKGKQSKESDPVGKFDLEDEDDAVTIISSTVNALSRNAVGTNSIERLNKQLLLQRRCHAAIFYIVLRSNGINCAEASKYYESIAHSFPTLSWKFYIKLNFHCKWSEYFIECCRELEPDIISIVLKKILCIEWANKEHLTFFSWNAVLQAIIWKFFIIEDSTLSSSQDCCSFRFPFVSSNAKTEISNPAFFEKDKDTFTKSQLLHSFVTLLNHFHSAFISNLSNFDFIKIILHAYKTIFRLLLKIKTCEKDVIKEIFRLNKFLESCCSEKQSLDVIEAVLQRKDEQIPLAHYYAVTSWDINANYLIFILCSYWNDVLESMSENAPYFSLEKCLPPSSANELLRSLNSFFKNKFETDDRNYILSLRNIIALHYPCATKAAVTLLLHPEARELNEVLIILEKEVPKLDIVEIYPVLADAIATAHSKDAKIRLLHLFFKILSESSGEIYNDALEYILNHYGINDHFQFDDFNNKLDCFTRKMVSEEAEKFLLPLFIQSPRDVLKMLIEQVLLQGSNETYMLKILKQIPIACLHSDSLVKELKPYFIKNDMNAKEMNNIVGLIESLMEVQTETSIMEFNMFLQEIIAPNLVAEKKVSFTLECLNASFNVLVSKKALKIKTEALFSLIHCLSSVIDKCIKLGDGRIKDLAISTLSLLSKCEKITDALNTELWNDLSSHSTSVLVYFSKLFGKTSYSDLKGSDSKLNDSMWLWCCNFKDCNLFQGIILEKKIPYEEVVSVLVSVLPHLTKEEWFQLTHLIEEYVRKTNLEVLYPVPWLLPKSDPRLYAVIRCLMDSYHFALKKGVYDLIYVSNCFSNTIQRILSQEVNLHLYLNVFLDTCHLTLDNIDEVYRSLLPLLLTVKKSVEDECKDQHLKIIYLKLMYHSIKCLPDSEKRLPFFTARLKTGSDC